MYLAEYLRRAIDAAALDNDPDNFDPTVNIRGTFCRFQAPGSRYKRPVDYDRIDLPVFTCSSRDYVRLKGEQPAACFINGNGMVSPQAKFREMEVLRALITWNILEFQHCKSGVTI